MRGSFNYGVLGSGYSVLLVMLALFTLTLATPLQNTSLYPQTSSQRTARRSDAFQLGPMFESMIGCLGLRSYAMPTEHALDGRVSLTPLLTVHQLT